MTSDRVRYRCGPEVADSSAEPDFRFRFISLTMTFAPAWEVGWIFFEGAEGSRRAGEEGSSRSSLVGRRDSVESCFLDNRNSVNCDCDNLAKRECCSATSFARASSLTSQSGMLSAKWTKPLRASIASGMVRQRRHLVCEDNKRNRGGWIGIRKA